MHVSLTHEEYESDFAVEFQTDAKQYDVNMRIVFKDTLKGFVLQDANSQPLADEFTLQVKDNNVVSECATSAVVFDSVTRDISMSFKDTTVDAQYYNIENALETSAAAATQPEHCRAVYSLFA
jgi:hypothetical protein